MRLHWALIGCVVALAPAEAAGKNVGYFIVSNPSDFERPDAVIDLPDPDPRVATWSARVHDRLLPAQRIDGVIRVVATLAPREKLNVDLVRGPVFRAPVRVRATLNVREADGRYTPRQAFQVPAAHTGSDGLIAFEGIGWESDRAGYRIYLDGRNVIDLFGKIKPEPVFPRVGQGQDDYQYPRDWGGDIFKVGTSLGVGGIGLLRDGHPTQTGVATLSASIRANGPVTAIAGVDADAIGGGAGSIHALYAISAGNALTRATVLARSLDAPLVTGLTVHPGDETIRSGPGAGPWAYIAVWGPQEHGPDLVGTALFYRTADVTGVPAQDAANLYIRFTSSWQADYFFAGRWTQENRLVPGYLPVTDLPAFRLWLERQREMLEKPVIISPRALAGLRGSGS